MIRLTALCTHSSALLNIFRGWLLSRSVLALENAALRQQLAVYQRTAKRPRLPSRDPVFWIAIRRIWSAWDRSLVMVKPETVISWHRQGFRLLWRRKSRSAKIGRPRIPREHINFIRRISGDPPDWGGEKIAEELAAKFGIYHSPTTVRQYRVLRPNAPRGDQTWRTFIRNHGKAVWSCDFLTRHTAFFAVAYVFVIMEIGSRRIVHVNVTSNPTWPWVKQQIREATASGEEPRFRIHDNDGIFGQYGRRVVVEREDRKCSYRCHLDRWLDEVIGIKGLPIPYGAPNASPHVERLLRTLREEALNHFLFLSVDHIRRVVTEYIRYYNGARPSQALHAIPDPYPELRHPPPRTGKLVALPVLGGVLHDYRRAA